MGGLGSWPDTCTSACFSLLQHAPESRSQLSLLLSLLIRPVLGKELALLREGEHGRLGKLAPLPIILASNLPQHAPESRGQLRLLLGLLVGLVLREQLALLRGGQHGGLGQLAGQLPIAVLPCAELPQLVLVLLQGSTLRLLLTQHRLLLLRAQKICMMQLLSLQGLQRLQGAAVDAGDYVQHSCCCSAQPEPMRHQPV